jgi:hypothetical protein
MKKLVNGELVDMTPEDIASLPKSPTKAQKLASERQQIASQRRAAMTAEADPLFFEWQAGEATEAEWKAKRQEIKARFQMPDEKTS